MVTFIGSVGAKIAAQMGLNVAQAQGAVASAAQAPPPVGFASAAAMIALLAGIGIAISGGGGGSYVDTSNQGTGTVFGDSEAQSSILANSIDILSDNSDLMLPLTSAMLRSLKNIESSIGGVTNLILRGEIGEGLLGARVVEARAAFALAGQRRDPRGTRGRRRNGRHRSFRTGYARDHPRGDRRAIGRYRLRREGIHDEQTEADGVHARGRKEPQDDLRFFHGKRRSLP